jgi:DNA-binding transcriptional LysR family regulator
MNSDQLPHLETFAKAAELSNFTAAAHALGLTQAAVSQRIGALERALGVSLFRRQGGRVLLTEAGQRLYTMAQRILLLHQEARQQVTGEKPAVRGELRLGASSIPGEHLLPRFLSVFGQRYPHIQVQAMVSDTLAVLKQVEHGGVHLGLVGGKRNSSQHLEFRAFACDKLVLVVPPDHPLARRKQIAVKQLSRLALILREAGSGSRWCLEDALARVGKSVKELRITLELGSNEAIKEAILRGLGVAILSTHVVKKELQAGDVKAVRISDLPLKRDMFLVWDRRRVLPIPARLFLDFLQPCPGASLGS